MNLGERVKYRRELLGMTQEALAYEMGYKSKSSINKIENGRAVTQKIIVKLADALKCSPAYLMGWEIPDIEMHNVNLGISPTVEAMNMAYIRDSQRHLKAYIDALAELDLKGTEMDKVVEYARFIKSQRSDK